MRLRQVPSVIGYWTGWAIARTFAIAGAIWAGILSVAFGQQAAQDYGNALLSGIMQGGKGFVRAVPPVPMPPPADIPHDAAQAMMANARNLEEQLQIAVGAKLTALRCKANIDRNTVDFLFMSEAGGLVLSTLGVHAHMVPPGFEVDEPVGSVVNPAMGVQ